MKKTILVSILVLLVSFMTSCTRLETDPVTYEAGNVTLKGYLAYDKSYKGKRPGILVVHEWWGHNEYARKRARMLAKLGYTALAVDMYGEGKQAAHPEDASEFSKALWENMDITRARFEAAMEVLKSHKTVDPERIAAIGYCLGGGVILQMAREGVDLDGVVSFHGNLATSRPATAGSVKAKILICNGTEDLMTGKEQKDAFIKEMENAGASYRFIDYSGAKHSFTNPEADSYAEQFDLPLGYNAEADRKSWADMERFLKEVLGK